MLVTIRNRVHGWFSYVLIGLIGLVFLLFGVSTRMGQNAQTVPIASVNGEDIPAKIYEREFQRALQTVKMRKEQQNDASPIDEQQIAYDVFQSLTTDKVLLHAAKGMGFILSPKTVDALIVKDPTFSEGGQFSQEKFERYAQMNRFTPAGFKSELHDRMIIGLIRNSLASATIFPTDQINRTYQLYLQKRDIAYLRVPVTQYIDNTPIDDKAINEYYASHQNDFQSPERVQVEYLELTPSDLENRIDIDETDIAAYYASHVAQFKTAKSVRIKHLLLSNDNQADVDLQVSKVEKAIQDQIPFNNLVETYSEDSATKQQHGDLGWFSGEVTGKAMRPLVEAAMAVTKTNKIVGPIDSPYGKHFIQVTEIVPEKIQPLAEVSTTIKAQLKKSALEKSLLEAREELDALSFENVDGLSDIAAAMSLSVKTSAFMTRTVDSNQGIGQQPGIVEASFSDAVLLDAANSEVISLPNNHLVVLRLKSHQPQKPLSAEEASDQISKILKHDLALKKVRAQAGVIIEKLRAGVSYSKAIDGSNLQWQHKAEVMTFSFDVPRDILEALFTMPRPVDDKPEFKAIALDNGDFAVLMLKSVVDATVPGSNDKQYQSVKQVIRQNVSGQMLSAYQHALQENADIEIYSDNIPRLKP